MKGQICALGLVICFTSLVSVMLAATLLGPEPAYAKTAASSDDVMVVTSNTRGGAQDLFWVIHTLSNRLLVYEVRGGKLTLQAARNIEFDLLLEEYPKGGQSPAVDEIRKATKGRKDRLSDKRKIIAVSGNYLSNQRDLLYVLDTMSMRQVVYAYNNGELHILAARNILYDLRLNEYPEGKHHPSFSKVREKVKG